MNWQLKLGIGIFAFLIAILMCVVYLNAGIQALIYLALGMIVIALIGAATVLIVIGILK